MPGCYDCASVVCHRYADSSKICHLPCQQFLTGVDKIKVHLIWALIKYMRSQIKHKQGWHYFKLILKQTQVIDLSLFYPSILNSKLLNTFNTNRTINPRKLRWLATHSNKKTKKKQTIKKFPCLIYSNSKYMMSRRKERGDLQNYISKQHCTVSILHMCETQIPSFSSTSDQQDRSKFNKWEFWCNNYYCYCVSAFPCLIRTCYSSSPQRNVGLYRLLL